MAHPVPTDKVQCSKLKYETYDDQSDFDLDSEFDRNEDLYGQYLRERGQQESSKKQKKPWEMVTSKRITNHHLQGAIKMAKLVVVKGGKGLQKLKKSGSLLLSNLRRPEGYERLEDQENDARK